MSKFWTRLAAALTIVWVAFWIFAIAIEWQNFKTLSFNEVGDFMAGSFGPVAFLWLVLGFFQQGEELKNNVEALKLQAEELRHSVEQQKEMVAVTRETLDHERKALEQQEIEYKRRIQPRFEPLFKASVGQGDQKAKYDLTLHITNNVASSVQITLKTEDTHTIVGQQYLPYIQDNTSTKISDFGGQMTSKYADSLIVEISYMDRENTQQKLMYLLSTSPQAQLFDPFKATLIASSL